ncbi:IclR family transcriptional regulator [Halopelagius longus]|uniref:IclR family transcriptional regulator n=1 Tax=Halopelagius longus TaxID=1236180 RepID=A0A1H1G5F5_9EURY|nr:IclR family transcriptional regulator [Halopelagius longus]RDI69851.1 IclR family transcriptional regulator [Halopelagius longus]SDR08046.1 transcriptional regulator, IclR family [Halopelagius longus]
MTSQDIGEQSRTIRSVEIALNVIDVLQRRTDVGVTELADELGHSKSTVHSHLRTLEERKMIVRDGNSYRLSLRILDMATYVRDQVGNYEVIEDEVESLAEETGEIAQFGIEEFGRVSYLCKATGDRAVETASRVGTQQPIHSTSLGKSVLAFLPEEERDAIVDGIDFVRVTPNTITSRTELVEELAAIRERGYALDDEENIEGLRCVAAPVRDGNKVLGAISISGPSSRFTESVLHGELADYVQRAANVIELNTKFS